MSVRPVEIPVRRVTALTCTVFALSPAVANAKIVPSPRPDERAAPGSSSCRQVAAPRAPRTCADSDSGVLAVIVAGGAVLVAGGAAVRVRVRRHRASGAVVPQV